MSRYQKDKTNLDFTEARDSEWQWHQLGHMQVCTSLQTDNHASTPPLSLLQAGCPSCRPTNSVKVLKALFIFTDTPTLKTILKKSACVYMLSVYVCHSVSLQSNPVKWIALGPDYEYPCRQSIHLSI